MNKIKNSTYRPLHKFHLLSILTVMSIAVPSVAQADCSADWVDINAVEDNGTVEIYAINPREVPITVTLQVWTRYMSADRSRTVTQTVPPKTSQLFIVLNETDENNKSRYSYDCEWNVGGMDATHDEDLIYHLPYEIGKSYRVLQGYGSRLSHTGPEQYTVDFKMHEGTPVHAARAGIVARIEESHSKGCWKDGCGKYANYIVILHDDWTTGEYYHLQKDGALVEIGDRVVAGQMIGLSGNTGNSALPHLHFGVYRAAPWGKFQSIPVSFSSIDGIVRNPRRGGLYQAVSNQSSAKRAADAQNKTLSLN
jgi:murein DD-endopeptidase MepM/ murein hydrolase activator NlpD